jgi:hypothetical protein
MHRPVSYSNFVIVVAPFVFALLDIKLRDLLPGHTTAHPSSIKKF